MNLIFKLAQNNMDDHLCTKCLEEYKEFHPVQQGGPLMLYLVLRKIQDVSENSIQHLHTQLKNMKISLVPGENVDVQSCKVCISDTQVRLDISSFVHTRRLSMYDPQDLPDDIRL